MSDQDSASRPTLEPFSPLSVDETAAVLENLSLASVAVVGDFCLDVYWSIDRSTAETSVETGLVTEPIRTQRYAPGGAGNVVANLRDLGVKHIFPVGVLGDDPFGRELRRLLDDPAIDSHGLLTQTENWATHAYVKPHVDDQEMPRLDAGNFNRLSNLVEDELFDRLEKIVERAAVVLINQQAIGSVHDSEPFRLRLAGFIERHPEVCFLIDSRKYHESYTRAVHKLNEREVMRASDVTPEDGNEIDLETLVTYARRLQASWKAPLVVTRGNRGCLVLDGTSEMQTFAIQLPGRPDPVGAGDTFVASLAAIVSTGTNLMAAAFVANTAASVTAQKRFETGTASQDEILQQARQAEYVFHPELAASPRKARFWNETEIEVVAPPPESLAMRHAMFDHDGTVSTLREGWEQIMEPMMIRAIAGDQFGTLDEVFLVRIEKRVREFIERTTGIQTIVQMQGLVDLVKEFALVPDAQIRSAAEYKAVFNVQLKALVNQRLAKLDAGELEVEDFTLKGAVPFLRALRRAGVTLYLASGTDEEDVKLEAERLGYASLFNGGIHGSIGEVTRDAKRIVVERILQAVGDDSGQLVAFGDGPVEIREAVRCGSYAVGVASDELRRFGSNPEKRKRLIRAGAPLVVSDFSQWPSLWKFLRLPQLVEEAA